VTCDEVRELLSPYADGELDLVRALEIERHLADCPDCAAALERLRALSARLADPALYHVPPPGLAARVRASLRPRSSLPWRRAALGAAAALLAAAALWGIVRGLMVPSAEDMLAREVVNAHVHSLMAGHLLDFPSDNRHKVKPWFDGRVDVAPEVKDLGDQFPLAGGREEYVDGRPAAAVVYRRRDHVINVLVWREAGRDRPPAFLGRQGYHLAHWHDNGRAFWVVSDLNEEELRQFVELLRR
jgi:anti-sigma factor RsiW